MERQIVSLEATLIVLDELVAHPEIKTDADKVSFVKSNLGLSNTEFDGILRITAENQHINPILLDQTFALVSLLNREIIPGHLPELVRTKAPTWEDKTALEAMAEGKTEDMLIHYRDTFNWDYRG